MTRGPLPAKPRRQPRRLWRVRWTRDHWKDSGHGRQWAQRYYLTIAGAEKAAGRLLSSGAVVEIDVYNLDHVRSDRWEP